ncbi:MAG: hypothetical protein K0R14_352 [Burkholderiales bacterium]|jgi:hypothetical protein|nr:hypothetical protein [Burkholderiales bacterium]
MKSFKLASFIGGIFLLLCIGSAVAEPKFLQTGACFKPGTEKVIFSWVLDDTKKLLTSNSETPNLNDLSKFKVTATKKFDKSNKKLTSTRYNDPIDGAEGPWFFDIDINTLEKTEQDWRMMNQKTKKEETVVCHVNNFLDAPTALVGTPQQLENMSITWFLPITDAGKSLPPMWIAYSNDTQIEENDIPRASDNFRKNIKTFFGGEAKLIIITKLISGSKIPTEILGENDYGKWSFIRQMSEEKRWFWIISGTFLNPNTGKPDVLKDVPAQSRSNDFHFKFHKAFNQKKLYPLLTEIGDCGYSKDTLDEKPDPYFVLHWERYADNKILWSIKGDTVEKISEKVEGNKLTAMTLAIRKNNKTISTWKLGLLEELPYKVQKWSLSRHNEGAETLPDNETLFCNIIDYRPKYPNFFTEAYTDKSTDTKTD